MSILHPARNRNALEDAPLSSIKSGVVFDGGEAYLQNAGAATIGDGLIGHVSPSVQGTGSGSLDDLTGGGNDATLVDVAWAADTGGNGSWGIQFNNDSGQTVDVPIPDALGVTSFSFSTWRKQYAPTGTAYEGLLSHYKGGDRLMLNRISSSMTLQSYLSNDGSSTIGGSVGTVTVTQNDWNHYVIRWNGTLLEVFVDAVKEDDREIIQTALNPGGTGVFNWGGRSSSNEGVFDGLFDTLRFYDRAITDQEIQTLFDAGRGEDTGGEPPPSNTTPPVVSGDALVGALLTTTQGSWDNIDGASFGYRWEYSPNGVDTWQTISGATGTTYTVHQDYLSQYIRSVVSVTTTGGSDEEPSSNSIGPITQPSTFQAAWATQATRVIGLGN